MSDNEYILVSDSPPVARVKKRKHESDSEPSSPVPKHPLLDSVSHVFKQNRDERESKIAKFHAQREAEKVHSAYIQKYEASPHDLARAGYAAGHWAKKNGMKVTMPKTSQITPIRDSPIPGSSSVKRQRVCVTSTPVLIPDSPDVERLSPELEKMTLASLSSHTVTSTEKTTCPVLYCDAKFDSIAKLDYHMNLFKHSPCDPCRLITNTKLKPDPCCYRCPLCDLEFPSQELCKDHMCEAQHVTFMTPLAITAFMCTQCMFLFDTFETCLSHMQEVNHSSFCFPFSGDDSDDGFSMPVPVGEEFMHSFINKCRRIKYKIKCMDCDYTPFTPRQLKEHLSETNNLHTFSSLTNVSVCEVISEYLASNHCNICQRLFSSDKSPEEFHNCAEGVKGNIKEGTANTFAEFIKRCSLTMREDYKESDVVCLSDSSCTDTDSVDIIPVVVPSASLVKTEPTMSKPHETDVTKSLSVKTGSGGATSAFVKSEPIETQKIHCTKVKTEHSISSTKTVPVGLNIINTIKVDTNGIKTEKEEHVAPKSSIKSGNIQKPVVGSLQSKNVISKAKFDISSSDDEACVINLDDSSSEESYTQNSSQVQGGSNTPNSTKTLNSKDSRTNFLTSTENLKTKTNIIFLDLDNFPSFFYNLPQCPSTQTFVWVFYGPGTNFYSKRIQCPMFKAMERKQMVYVHKQCGRTKDAADFALVLTLGKLDATLPSSVSFTILSADKGFCEIERQMKDSNRKAMVINQKECDDHVLLGLLHSIAEM